MYHGPFLSGFHLSDADEFERWVDGERSRLARRYGQALEQLAGRQMRDGDPVRAAEWWSRLAGEDPYNSRIALGYMQALEAAGDRAGRYDMRRCTPTCCAPISTLRQSAKWLRWQRDSGSSRAPPRATFHFPAQSRQYLSRRMAMAEPPLPTAPGPETPRPRRRSWGSPDSARPGDRGGAGGVGGKAHTHATSGACSSAGSGCPVRESNRAPGPRGPRRPSCRLDDPGCDGDADG